MADQHVVLQEREYVEIREESDKLGWKYQRCATWKICIKTDTSYKCALWNQDNIEKVSIVGNSESKVDIISI